VKNNFVTPLALSISMLIHAAMIFSAQKSKSVTPVSFGEKISSLAKTRTFIHLRRETPRNVEKITKKISKLKKTNTKVSHSKVKQHKNVSKQIVKQSSGRNDVLARYASTVRDLISKNKKYPRVARRLKQQGIVKVYFEVTYPNKISNLKVIEASDYEILNNSALDSIRSLENLPHMPENHANGLIPMTIPLNYEIL